MKRPTHGGNLTWAAAIAGCPPSAILDFSASINPLGPPQSAIAAIQSHLGDLVAYPDPDYHQLRQALARVHRVPPEWILPGNGAAELLMLAGRALSERNGVSLITPAFSGYWRAFQAFNVRAIAHPLTDEEGDIIAHSDDTDLPIGNPAPGFGLLLNNPHNPTGKLWKMEAIAPYLEQFDLVVADEAFMDFLPPSQQQSLIEHVATHPNLVVVRSLTKFYSLPGLRLGYAIAHPDRLREWQQWRDPWPVNALAAAAGMAVVSDTGFAARTRQWLPTARSQLFDGLARLPGLQPLPGAANFLLVRSRQSSSQLQQALLQRHQILIRDCLSFEELGDRYFRVAVRSDADNRRLLDGLSIFRQGTGW